MRRFARRFAVPFAFVLVFAACSNGNELEAIELQLSEVTAERDALQLRVQRSEEVYEKTAAVKTAIREILDDPDSFGSQEEVADLLAAYATPDAVMEDDVYGPVPMRDAWYRTLHSETEADIEVLHQWISADGSQSGGLWVWKGDNIAGNPFELVGVSIDTHNEEGLVLHELVIYPYADAYVIQAVEGAGN